MRSGEIAAAVLPPVLVDGWTDGAPVPGLRRLRMLPVDVAYAMAVSTELPVLRDVLDAFVATRAAEVVPMPPLELGDLLRLDGLRPSLAAGVAATSAAALAGTALLLRRRTRGARDR
jgi:hypothetical protein